MYFYLIGLANLIELVNQSNQMKTAIDFVKANVTIRKDSFIECPKLFNSIVFSQSIELVTKDLEMLKKISSKSFVNGLVTNRVQGLECLLEGKNFITGIKYKHFDLASHAHPFIISCYILAGQVFSDGNHRVVFEYLTSQGFEFAKSIKYIQMIDHCRQTKNLSWENIHEFIQILISNIVAVKGEIELSKKIENMFI